MIEAIGDVIPDAFAGDAHAYLVGIYKDPTQERHARQDAAKAALPYEKSRPVTVTLANAGAEPLKVRSEGRARGAGRRANDAATRHAIATPIQRWVENSCSA